MPEHLDYDEESFREKAKRGAGVFTLIGSGILSVLHILSHIVPAIGVVGLSLGEGYGLFYNIVSHEYMQIAYLPFVLLSFWYMYRDHTHHTHEKELRKELGETKKQLENLLKKR